jgi:hypothetical protein
MLSIRRTTAIGRTLSHHVGSIGLRSHSERILTRSQTALFTTHIFQRNNAPQTNSSHQQNNNTNDSKTESQQKGEQRRRTTVMDRVSLLLTCLTPVLAQTTFNLCDPNFNRNIIYHFLYN